MTMSRPLTTAGLAPFVTMIYYLQKLFCRTEPTGSLEKIWTSARVQTRVYSKQWTYVIAPIAGNSPKYQWKRHFTTTAVILGNLIWT